MVLTASALRKGLALSLASCVGTADYLSKAVESEDGLIGTRLGVVDYVEVDELLELDARGLHVLDDVHEQHRYVLATCHGVDYLSWLGGIPVARPTASARGCSSSACPAVP